MMESDRRPRSVKFRDLALRWKVGVVGMFAACALNFYFGVTDSGLFPILVGLQDRVLGLHFTGVTFFVSLVPLLVPVVLLRDPIASLLRRLGVPDPGELGS